MQSIRSMLEAAKTFVKVIKSVQQIFISVAESQKGVPTFKMSVTLTLGHAHQTNQTCQWLPALLSS